MKENNGIIIFIALFLTIIGFLFVLTDSIEVHKQKLYTKDSINKITDSINNITSDSMAKHNIIKMKNVLNTLPNYTTFKNDDLKITFSPFIFSNDFICDRYSLGYSSEWHYKRADRGNKYLLSIATITSKNKNPLLPDIYAYYIDSTNIHFISKFEYRLYSWSDYGSYLGNYTDYKNDFAYTETINFDIGALIDEKYMTLPIIIIASKSGNVIRSNNIYGNPSISYQSDNSITSLTINELYNNYTIITVLNKHKL